MWSSEFAAVSAKEGYHNALELSRALLPERHREQVLGRTAARVFRLSSV